MAFTFVIPLIGLTKYSPPSLRCFLIPMSGVEQSRQLVRQGGDWLKTTRSVTEIAKL